MPRVLGLLATVGLVRLWIIWAAHALALVKCFDLSAIRGLVMDLVGPDDLPNAVPLR